MERISDGRYEVRRWEAGGRRPMAYLHKLLTLFAAECLAQRLIGPRPTFLKFVRRLPSLACPQAWSVIVWVAVAMSMVIWMTMVVLSIESVMITLIWDKPAPVAIGQVYAPVMPICVLNIRTRVVQKIAIIYR